MRGIEIIHPEIVQMRRIRAELKDNPRYIRIPFIIAVMSKISVRFRRHSVAHLYAHIRLGRHIVANLGHDVVQSEDFDLLRRFKGAESGGYAIHSFLDILHGSRIREADEIVRPECRSGDNRNLRFLQQVIRQTVGIANLQSLEFHVVIALHVGHQVECSLRLKAGYSVQHPRPVEHIIPSLLEFRLHLGNFVLRTVQSFHTRPLHYGRRIGRGMRLDFSHSGDQSMRSDSPAQTPSGHGISLGKSVDYDRIFHSLFTQLADAGEAETVIDQLLINLVGDDDKPFLQG